jgi:hypothetical protein
MEQSINMHAVHHSEIYFWRGDSTTINTTTETPLASSKTCSAWSVVGVPSERHSRLGVALSALHSLNDLTLLTHDQLDVISENQLLVGLFTISNRILGPRELFQRVRILDSCSPHRVIIARVECSLTVLPRRKCSFESVTDRQTNLFDFLRSSFQSREQNQLLWDFFYQHKRLLEGSRVQSRSRGNRTMSYTPVSCWTGHSFRGTRTPQYTCWGSEYQSERAPAWRENATNSCVLWIQRVARVNVRIRGKPKGTVESSGTVQLSMRYRDEEISRQNRKECDQTFGTEARIVSIFWKSMICLWNIEKQSMKSSECSCIDSAN